MGDTLSNPQLVSALKIARNEVEDAKKNGRGYYAAGTNERLVGAAQQYLSNQDLSIGDQTDFIQAVGQYHNGLATIALVDAMTGGNDLESLSSEVINNKSVNSKNTIEVSEFSMKRANDRLWSVMIAGTQAVDFVSTIGLFPEVGAAPKGIQTPRVVTKSNEMGKIIGWGETSGKNVALAVEKTKEVTSNLTRAQVQAFKNDGLTKEWVEEQVGFYNKALANPAKSKNPLVAPRKELMEKILYLWKP